MLASLALADLSTEKKYICIAISYWCTNSGNQALYYIIKSYLLLILCYSINQ